jgi:RimJ/RimL family protein N-acetyltransferase
MTNYWQGKRIVLRQTEPSDWETHHRWNMDTDMMSNLDQLIQPRSKEAAKIFADESSKKTPTGDQYHLEIELLKTQELIGSIGTNNVDTRNGHFRYGIGIDRNFRKQGYASEAILLLLNFFFDELRYQKCNVDIASWNEGSISLHERLGFQKEGHIRRTVFRQGQYFDSLLYGLTVEEWREKHHVG